MKRRLPKHRYGIRHGLALDMATQVFAEPHTGLQRLYGNLQDKVMKKADGRRCEVSFLRTFNIRATEDNLEYRVAKREHDSNLGFLPVQLEDTRYKVYIYRITNLLD